MIWKFERDVENDLIYMSGTLFSNEETGRLGGAGNVRFHRISSDAGNGVKEGMTSAAEDGGEGEESTSTNSSREDGVGSTNDAKGSYGVLVSTFVSLLLGLVL